MLVVRSVLSCVAGRPAVVQFPFLRDFHSGQKRQRTLNVAEANTRLSDDAHKAMISPIQGRMKASVKRKPFSDLWFVIGY